VIGAALLAFALPAWMAFCPPAEAGVRRFGVMVGNNEGTSGMPLLYFAEQDAEKMSGVLTSVGGYQADDVAVVLGGNRSEVMQALVSVRGEIAMAHAKGDETLFLFYYSGHANKSQLQLGRTWLTYDELDRLVELTGADVRLAFLDACQSGAMTRSKGGTLKPGFMSDITEKLGSTGQVIITSSSGDESSQESDEIGGSYFTHFLTSALVGAADEDADERITLAEAYRYVYHETVFRTSGTRGGSQHPTYEWDLAGKGDVVLADLSAARSSLEFAPDVEGTVAIFDQNRRMFVAELELGPEGDRVSLRPGAYLIQKRYPTHLEVARVDLADGATVIVGAADFEAMAYEDDQAKGIIAHQIKEMRLPRLSLRIVVGRRGFTSAKVSSSYIPQSPAAGASLRFAWRDGRWVAGDVVSGAVLTNLSFDGLDYTVPVLSTSTTLGIAAGFATRPNLLQAGAGVRLAGAWFRRDFLDGSTEPQDLFTVSPGLLVFAGWHPGRVEVDIEYHLQVLPYKLDLGLHNLLFGESLLALGYRF
jgi:hypothetical protein